MNTCVSIIMGNVNNDEILNILDIIIIIEYVLGNSQPSDSQAEFSDVNIVKNPAINPIAPPILMFLSL